MKFYNIIKQIDTMNKLDKVSYFINDLKEVTRKKITY